MNPSPEEAEESDSPAHHSSHSWRACENCRVRKIKCDKRSPCSNCRASNAICRTIPKPKESKQRILISNQYEKKIALIEDRLSRMEGLLQDLVRNTAGGSRPPENLPQTSSEQAQSLPSVKLSGFESDAATPNRAFEGESSFGSHSIRASAFVERAMHGNSLGRDPKMENALATLRDLVQKQNTLSINQDLRFPAQKEPPTLDLSALNMPPMTSVVTLFKICKDIPLLYLIDLPFLDYGTLSDMCKRVYFAMEDYPVALFTLVNGGLYYLFLEVALIHGKNTTEFSECAKICRSNLEYALGKFDLFTAPTVENIQALAIGAAYAIEISRPSLSWALTSNAVRLCESLGFHRSVEAPGDTPPEIDKKKTLFWFIYSLDKSLSLRLGISSKLPDYDITLDRPHNLDHPGARDWDLLYDFEINLSRFRGRVFEELYSAHALSDSGEDRALRARNIVEDMQICVQGLRKADISTVYNPYYYKSLLDCFDVAYGSLLTLIYRSIPPDPSDVSAVFNADCLETARTTIRAHQGIVMKYKDNYTYLWRAYISWVLVQCPFTPFIVLFCNAIAQSDLEDVKLLGSFVSSLGSAAETSEAAQKLYRLCHIFHHVAELYIEAKMGKASEKQISDNPGDATSVNYLNHFDPYLHALGFPPTSGISAAPGTTMPTGEVYIGGDPREEGADPGTFRNWFAGDLNIMSLLETDLPNVYHTPM